MKDNQNFTEGPILKKMLLFMIPILGALILQAMYSAVDLLIVGQFGTTEGISAVSTGSNIVNWVVFTVTGLAMGVTVLISRYIGQKRQDEVGQILGGVIAFFTVLAVILTIFLLALADPIATLMQAPKDAHDLTVLYIRICGGGMFFVIAYNVISSIFRGLGDSKMPLLFVMIACIVNVIGDLALVAGLHMNVAGAAIATVGAQAVSVLLSLLIIKYRGFPFKFTVKDIRFSRVVRHFLRLGSPIALQEFLTQVSFLALCAFINRLGMDASAGYGVAQKIVTFVMLVPSSLMQSMSSIIGQNVGAGKEDRARHALFLGMAVGASIGVVIFLAAFFKGNMVSMLFTKDVAVQMKSWEYLRGFALEAIVTSALFSYIGYFNGHGETLFVMLQGMAQTLLVRLPVAFFMSIQPGATLTMIGVAAPSATITGIVICTVYYRRYQKRIASGRQWM